MPKSAYPTAADLALFLRRAGFFTDGTGTLASSGTTVTGSSTVFLSQLEAGDWIVAGGQARKVAAIASNTSLTTDTAFSPVLPAGTMFSYIRQDLETAAEAGRQTFERLTHRVMLAPVGDVTKEFDPTLARNGILVIPDLIALTSIAYQPEGSTSTLWTQNTDFWPLPDNAPDNSLPYQMIRLNRSFYAPIWGAGWRSIRITGRWGFGTTIPEDAWLAMVQLGAMELVAGLEQAISGGVLSWHSANRGEQYSIRPLGSLADQWTAQANGAVKRYKRITL